MAIPFQSLLLLLLLSISFSPSSAEIRSTDIRFDSRLIIPFDEFGFTHSGRLELNVSSISLSNPNVDLSKLGFFLCTRESWIHVVQQLEDSEINFPLDSNLIRIVFSFNSLSKNGASSFSIVFSEPDADQYTLVFANCFPDVSVSMKVRSDMYNLEGKNGGRDYLSAGRTILPRVDFLLSVIYFGLIVAWIWTLHKKRSTVFRIHFFMLAVLILKALNLLCEAEDKSYIKRTGTTHG